MHIASGLCYNEIAKEEYMKVKVRGKNKFVPSEAIKNYATNKLKKLDQYFTKSQELEADVLCKVYDTHHTVEITIPTKHVLLRSEVKADNIYSAIDSRLTNSNPRSENKSKIYRSLKRRMGVSPHYAANLDFDLEEMETEIKATKLVKSKTFELKPMTPTMRYCRWKCSDMISLFS